MCHSNGSLVSSNNFECFLEKKRERISENVFSTVRNEGVCDKGQTGVPDVPVSHMRAVHN